MISSLNSVLIFYLFKLACLDPSRTIKVEESVYREGSQFTNPFNNCDLPGHGVLESLRRSIAQRGTHKIQPPMGSLWCSCRASSNPTRELYKGQFASFNFTARPLEIKSSYVRHLQAVTVTF